MLRPIVLINLSGNDDGRFEQVIVIHRIVGLCVIFHDGFDGARERCGLFGLTHGLADAMEHEPSSFVGNPNLCLQPDGGYAGIHIR